MRDRTAGLDPFDQSAPTLGSKRRICVAAHACMVYQHPLTLVYEHHRSGMPPRTHLVLGVADLLQRWPLTDPYYRDDLVTLYFGDCLDVTEWLSADVLVTDPPYGIKWTTHGVSRTSFADSVRGDFNGQHRPTLSIQNDESTETRDAALRLWGTKPGFVFGSLLMPNPEATKHVAVYIKPLDAGSLTALGRLRRDVEAIYVIGGSSEWRPKKTGRGALPQSKRPPSEMRSSAFQTRVRLAGTSAGLAARSGHPHAKPLDVLGDLIKQHSGIVADPFAGSGSTLVAAKELGRHAIGIEVDERYCEIAAKRLAQDCLDLGSVS